MSKKRFEKLSAAIRHARAIQRGETAPGRVWLMVRGKGGKIHRRQLDPQAYRRRQRAEWQNSVAATRGKLGLSQSKFAALLSISPATLRNWEQGRRQPTGAAKVLLKVAARHPKMVLEAAA